MSATSATLETTARPTSVARGRVTQLRVFRSEWTKLWSLRSTRWTLGVAILGMAGLGPLIATVQMNRWFHMSPDDRLHFNAINTGLGGYHFAQLAIGVLAVLVLSGEYTTGQIRSSFMAVPKRLPVLWAKAGTFAAVTLVLMLVSGLIAFLASQSILTQHHVETSLSNATALRSCVGAGLYLAVLSVLAL
ncbi:MAG: ABC transporter permease, partial [Solirubrobacterales bacterium]|nr:ABC transporter permease [Solirubrobacterales bacterium]